MWDDGYPVLNEPDGAYRARLRVQEPWMIAARADELDREIRERAGATLSSAQTSRSPLVASLASVEGAVMARLG